MKQTRFPFAYIFLIFINIFIKFPSISSQTCQKTCGDLKLTYPFGSDNGCGDPRFHQFINCNQQKLTLTTHTGSYTVTNIDYTNQVLYITDPSMSTCDCMNQPSKGFGLDWDAPFTFHDDTIFALLDCSETSPIYTPNGLFNDGNSSSKLVSLCDNTETPICGFLYSCKPISTSTLSIPVSGCCVYTPVNFGPSFEMDLGKMKCGSYSGFYSFNGKETDAESWKYGIALKYKFSVNNVYPSWCSSCEKSGGVCGFYGVSNSYICNCQGFNTTTDCFLGNIYSHASKLLSMKPWIWLIIFVGWLLVWTF